MGLTCVQPLAQFFDLIGRTRLPVDPLRVESMHLDVVDEFLHQLRHLSFLAGQARQLHSKLARRQLRLVLQNQNTDTGNTLSPAEPITLRQRRTTTAPGVNGFVKQKLLRSLRRISTVDIHFLLPQSVLVFRINVIINEWCTLQTDDHMTHFFPDYSRLYF